MQPQWNFLLTLFIGFSCLHTLVTPIPLALNGSLNEFDATEEDYVNYSETSSNATERPDLEEVTNQINPSEVVFDPHVLDTNLTEDEQVTPEWLPNAQSTFNSTVLSENNTTNISEIENNQETERTVEDDPVLSATTTTENEEQENSVTSVEPITDEQLSEVTEFEEATSNEQLHKTSSEHHTEHHIEDITSTETLNSTEHAHDTEAVGHATPNEPGVSIEVTHHIESHSKDQRTDSGHHDYANGIKMLLGKLINKLDIPQAVLNNYRYITAMKSNDGSLYVPHNHKQSTRKHLATLLGFAEEIVSSQNALADVKKLEYPKDENEQKEREFTVGEILTGALEKDVEGEIVDSGSLESNAIEDVTKKVAMQSTELSIIDQLTYGEHGRLNYDLATAVSDESDAVLETNSNSTHGSVFPADSTTRMELLEENTQLEDEERQTTDTTSNEHTDQTEPVPNNSSESLLQETDLPPTENLINEGTAVNELVTEHGESMTELHSDLHELITSTTASNPEGNSSEEPDVFADEDQPDTDASHVYEDERTSESTEHYLRHNDIDEEHDE